MSNSYLNRRDFITFSATAAAMLGLSSCAGLNTAGGGPRKPRPIAPGAKIRIAQIGLGGKGFSDIMAHKDEEVVALCDVDWNPEVARNGNAAKAGKAPAKPNAQKLVDEFPNAKRYTDFRKMLIEMDDQIDAVGIATPDHMHFLPAYMAIMMGKHVYVQKPLTPTVGEARELLRLARMNGVCTQMGNQGHAGEGIRLVKEWYDAGLLGDVREVQIWTNRPVWPQGMTEYPKAEPKPKGLEWDLFLGRAPDREYSPAYHPFKWRGWRDYGCGALGDMACHIMDASYAGLELGAPESVELKRIEGASKVAFPKQAVVEFKCPARGNRPPVTLTWSEGGIKPERPKAFEKTDKDPERNLAQGGQLIIGSKGTVYDGNDYCNSPRFIPESAHKALVDGGKLPPRTLPRPDPIGNPHKEWTRAIRAGNPKLAGSNFEYSSPFTEVVALGTMAIIAGGKFTWDSANMKSNREDVNALLYPNYRKGWAKEDLKV